MVRVGDTAPNFTVPVARGGAYNDVEEFTLSEVIGDGPIVLAFYPATFGNGCTEEMCTFRDSISRFEELNARVYGISVDMPYAQNTWMEMHDLNFPFLSDGDHEVTEMYGVTYMGVCDMIEAAQRSVFVIDSDGEVTYKWVRDGDNPDFDELIAKTAAEVERIA